MKPGQGQEVYFWLTNRSHSENFLHSICIAIWTALQNQLKEKKLSFIYVINTKNNIYWLAIVVRLWRQNFGMSFMGLETLL